VHFEKKEKKKAYSVAKAEIEFDQFLLATCIILKVLLGTIMVARGVTIN
jgi:hypothetical protein